jgi:hypothetical protein
VHVAPAAREPGVEHRPLLGQEARLLQVALPVLDVGLRVGHVQVARHDGQPGGVGGELAHPQRHGAQEPHLLQLARGVALAGVHVRRHDGQRPGRGRDVRLDPAPAPLRAEHRQLGAHLQQRRPADDGHTRAALVGGLGVGDVPAREAGFVELVGQLLVVRPHLLQADHVGRGSCDPLQPTASGGGADAVDVGREDAEHGLSLSRVAGEAHGAVSLGTVRWTDHHTDRTDGAAVLVSVLDPSRTARSHLLGVMVHEPQAEAGRRSSMTVTVAPGSVTWAAARSMPASEAAAREQGNP